MNMQRSMWMFAVALTTALTAPLALCEEAQTFDLVKDGQAAAIVVRDEAGQAGKFAAKGLADYVEKLTGVLPVVQTADGKGPAVQIRQRNSAPDTPAGSYRWSVEAGQLVLEGVEAEGVLYAVYALLEEQCGVHWLRPGEEGEIIPPRRSTLTVTADGAWHKPAFRVRWINYNFDEPQTTETLLPLWDWALKNRLNGPFCVRNSRARKPEWDKFLAERGYPGDRIWGGGILIHAATYGKDHPEYYPLRGGRRDVRDKVKYCLTHPDVMKFHVDALVASAKDHPTDNFWRLPHSWWQRWCECDACIAACSGVTGGYGLERTDYLLKFLNDMMAAAEKQAGGKLPEVYVPVRMNTEPPPVQVQQVDPRLHFALEDGHAVTTIPADEGANMAAELDATLAGWGRVTHNMILNDAIFSIGSLMAPIEPHLARRYQYLAEITSVEGVNLVIQGNWSSQGLTYWCAAKLLWDPKTDLAAAKRAYYKAWYGPAGQAVGAARERLAEAIARHVEDAGSRNMPGYLARALEHLDRTAVEADLDAATQAAMNSQYLPRVKDFSLAVEYLLLGCRLAAEGDYRMEWSDDEVKLVPTGTAERIAASKDELLRRGIAVNSLNGIQWAFGRQEGQVKPITWKTATLRGDGLTAVVAVGYGGFLLKLENAEGIGGFQLLPLQRAIVASGTIGGWRDGGPGRYSRESWTRPYEVLEQTPTKLVVRWTDEKNALEFTKSYEIRDGALQHTCTIRNVGDNQRNSGYCTLGFPRLGPRASDDVIVVNTAAGEKIIDLHNVFGTMARYEGFQPQQWWGARDKATGWTLVNTFGDGALVNSWQTWDSGDQYTLELLAEPAPLAPGAERSFSQSLMLRKMEPAK